MKKLMILAAMLALAMATAVPAIAQEVGLETENQAESDEVATEFAVENTGDYASQCVPALQFGNTGNFNNAPSLAQFGSGGFVVEDDDDDDDRRNGIFDFFDDDRNNDRDDRVVRGGDTSLDDFEPGGLEFAIEPEMEVACERTVQQSSAASSS